MATLHVIKTGRVLSSLAVFELLWLLGAGSQI